MEEYLDIVDENGRPTGETVARKTAHREGIRHRTAHVWVIRRDGGRVRVLLQKRSRSKDSYPGLYDTSSAGHIPAGTEPLPSALRELAEELGIRARPEQLHRAGVFRLEYEEQFHGRPFRDSEVIHVFVYEEPVDIRTLTLQESEVEDVGWFDLEEVSDEIRYSRKRFCVVPEGLAVLQAYLRGSDAE